MMRPTDPGWQAEGVEDALLRGPGLRRPLRQTDAQHAVNECLSLNRGEGAAALAPGDVRKEINGPRFETFLTHCPGMPPVDGDEGTQSNTATA
ncbi:hypothetical protein [Vannielia litorea]|uniref:hypothetical protein n=1 Tax=Vannielia litorea TaxID=1217970 RepID=UPI001BCF711F|nr:hypothetical protein [Vannielia litorea]